MCGNKVCVGRECVGTRRVGTRCVGTRCEGTRGVWVPGMWVPGVRVPGVWVHGDQLGANHGEQPSTHPHKPQLCLPLWVTKSLNCFFPFFIICRDEYSETAGTDTEWKDEDFMEEAKLDEDENERKKTT